MANYQWIDGSESDVLTTGLDSLANNGRALSSAIDNDGGLNLYADFQLEVQYASAPTAGTKAAELYLLPTVDGTNYPEGGTSLDPQKVLLVGVFETRSPSTSVTERLVVTGVSLPPRDFKVLLKNTSGQAFQSSGNVLSIRPYKLQSV